ncbi:cold shock domain-containing protein [Escherichia coli]|nr:cold shock domain-containing protein [Escherichia coli]MDY8484743.1 cold shock domain-containing protein [Escherichia coli]MDY8526135.1 cold shock domain-containing protein [Escherichia coli]MDY8539672.1 cold shock domain-containing protein [Escherichia coli]MDY8594652.1 cold shock domain-containing protein [Escherichia coli]
MRDLILQLSKSSIYSTKPFSAIQSNDFKTLTENQEVEFGIENGPKGPAAVHVVAL